MRELSVILVNMIAAGTPILYALLGDMVSQRAGVGGRMYRFWRGVFHKQHDSGHACRHAGGRTCRADSGVSRY